MTEDHIKYVRRFIQTTTNIPEIVLPDELTGRIFCSLTANNQSAPLLTANDYAIPWIDQEIRTLAAKIKSDSCHENQSIWPENRPFALCLTHDVDFVSSVDHTKKFYRRIRRIFNAVGPRVIPLYQAAGSIYRLATGIGTADSLANYDRWLKIEEKYGYKSTFNFFSFPTVNESVLDCDYKLTDTVIFDNKSMNVAGMIKLIDDAGWEIGLHGSINTHNNLKLLNEQKKTLENIIQKEVISTRNHYLKHDISITPRIQADAGFRNDSTIGSSNISGFYAGTSFPYWCWDIEKDTSLPLLEIPMSLMDVTLFRDCTTREQFDITIEKCIKIMDEVERARGCLTLNWHPNYFINDFYWHAYSVLLQEAFRRNAWGCTAKEISEHWKLRDKPDCEL